MLLTKTLKIWWSYFKELEANQLLLILKLVLAARAQIPNQMEKQGTIAEEEPGEEHLLSKTVDNWQMMAQRREQSMAGAPQTQIIYRITLIKWLMVM